MPTVTNTARSAAAGGKGAMPARRSLLRLLLLLKLSAAAAPAAATFQLLLSLLLLRLLPLLLRMLLMLLALLLDYACRQAQPQACCLATLRCSTALVVGHCISCQLTGTMGTPATGRAGTQGRLTSGQESRANRHRQPAAATAARQQLAVSS